MAITPDEYALLIQAAHQGLLRSLDGKSFSLTGKLSMPREDVVKLIRACGGVWDEHPHIFTTYLIVGDTSRFGFTAKMQEAERRGTQVIYEDAFVEMLTPGMSS